MSKTARWLNKKEAELLGFTAKENDGKRSQNRYNLNKEDWKTILDSRESSKLANKVKSKTKSNDYIEKPLVLSAWNNSGFMMDIDEYCKHYSLPRKDISSYKLVSHTGTPFYNIVFKENVIEEVNDFNFEEIIAKHIKPIFVEKKRKLWGGENDFDTLTYTDVHIGMDSDSDNNTMYKKEWNKVELMKSADIIISETIKEQESNVLYVDDLGDLLDGFNGVTTRGGHQLPQNMTNEECFDAALEFKIKILHGLVNYYDKIHFNNICNDNHSGAFGYFVNKAFKEIAELQFDNVTVTNHRKFINHYFVGDVCFLISHGKDDKSLKFGFKPHLDFKGADKIDQYCKQNGIYKKAELVIFKKGDSHQALFDICTSDDFYYYNYPALSPSSNWIKNNFKLGRRGFVNETFRGLKNYLKLNFIK
jgi:hypothetical protein